jgi:hypothetical protein
MSTNQVPLKLDRVKSKAKRAYMREFPGNQFFEVLLEVINEGVNEGVNEGINQKVRE